MKTIEWELPCKTFEFLDEITADLVDVPEILLLTAVENCEGEITHCKITMVEDASEEFILALGEFLGAFSVQYEEKKQAIQEERRKAFESIKGDLKTFMEHLANAICEEGELLGKDLEEESNFDAMKKENTSSLLRELLNKYKK